MTKFFSQSASLLVIMGCAVFFSACSTQGDLSPKSGQEGPLDRVDRRRFDFGSMTGSEGLSLDIFGSKESKGGASSIGTVNRFLWQAAMDSISFMPLSSADAVGGIIVTDWYISPSTPNERIKMTIQIKDHQLRADALTVNIFKQVKGKGDQWVNTSVDSATVIQMENIILKKARELRVGSLNKS